MHPCGSRLIPRVQQVERTQAFYLHLNSLGAVSLNLTMLRFNPCGFGQAIVSLSISLLIDIGYKNRG